MNWKRSYNSKVIQNTIENNKSFKRTFKNISPGQKQIIALKTKYGNILHDRHKTGNGIVEFYEDLYKANVINKINRRSNNDGNQINMPDILIGGIETVLKSMPSNKALGPDHTITDMIEN